VQPRHLTAFTLRVGIPLERYRIDGAREVRGRLERRALSAAAWPFEIRPRCVATAEADLERRRPRRRLSDIGALPENFGQAQLGLHLDGYCDSERQGNTTAPPQALRE
jgi:hypothetical protein